MRWLHGSTLAKTLSFGITLLKVPSSLVMLRSTRRDTNCTAETYLTKPPDSKQPALFGGLQINNASVQVSLRLCKQLSPQGVFWVVPLKPPSRLRELHKSEARPWRGTRHSLHHEAHLLLTALWIFYFMLRNVCSLAFLIRFNPAYFSLWPTLSLRAFLEICSPRMLWLISLVGKKKWASP